MPLKLLVHQSTHVEVKFFQWGPSICRFAKYYINIFFSVALNVIFATDCTSESDVQ